MLVTRPLFELSSRGGSLQGGDKFRILPLLGEFEACIIVPLLEVGLPVLVQRIDDALGVHLAGT